MQRLTTCSIALLACALAIALASAPAGAASHACGGDRGGGGGGVGPRPASSGGTGVKGHHRGHAHRGCAEAAYVDPIQGPAWLAERTDMGVDYAVTRRKPIVAIGDALILGSDSKSPWPGGHFLWYQLLDGDHAGDIIYVAETMNRLVPAGTTVSAGERIATALPGGTGTEWGWANRIGQTRAAPCYHEGMKTNSGREMARFLRRLGAPTADDPGPGPDFPTGRLC